jgi:hypothetical protein
MHPSPKNSPGPSRAIVASLPCLEIEDHAEPHASVLNVEHVVRTIPLRKDGLLRAIAENSSADARTR